MFTGELLKQAERQISEGLHPRLITEGYEIAKDMVLEFLDAFKVPQPNIFEDYELLLNVAKTSLRTKLPKDLADKMSDNVVKAMKSVATPDEPIDLHMVEILEMQHQSGSDSSFINGTIIYIAKCNHLDSHVWFVSESKSGLVLDHGARHPDMPRYLEKAYILTCNVSMEYEKTEISAGFYYSNAEEREKLVESERKFTDEKVRQVIEFKRRVCQEGQSFVIVNQKGIDPLALDMLAKDGILALRRAKRRNMERLTLACGGFPVNSVDGLEPDVLGYAGIVREESLGDEKYTFIENARLGKSCTILIKGPNKHTLEQIKDATRDGLRAIKCALEDKVLVPGGCAFEIAAYRMLQRRKAAVTGRAKLGVAAFADALLVLPKTLAENSGFDVQDSLIKVEDEQEQSGLPVALDLNTGDTFLPSAEGVWDNYQVKRQVLNLSTVLASQLLLVDEVMKAGKAMGKAPEGGAGGDDE